MLRRVAGLTIVALCLIGTASAMATDQHACPKPADGVVIYGTNQNAKLVGTPENDCIIGGPGSERIWGGQDRDGLYGGQGSDTIHSVDAEGNHSGTWEDNRADIVDGGPGRDLCIVSSDDAVANCEVVMLG